MSQPGGWLHINKDEPFKLHSGLYSICKVETKGIFTNPATREFILDGWEKSIRSKYPDVKDGTHRFFGVPTGGTPWAEALAKRMKGLLRYDYRDGRYADKEPTFIVDDVLTTGSQVKELGCDHEPLLVVVRRWDYGNHPPQVLNAWMDVRLPILDQEKSS